MGQELTRGRSLESLRKEAKRWLKAVSTNDAAARARLDRALGSVPANPSLRDVQHALALEMGFAGWAALKNAATERPRSASESAAGRAALARYEDMADALLDAYRTGTPEAMSRHYAHTWHRRAWQGMRTYVQLDLGKRPAAEGADVEITIDDARKLVALEYGFGDWDAVRSFALSLTENATSIAAKPVALTTGDETTRRIVERTRDWSAAIGLMAEQHATGLDAHGQMTDAGRASRTRALRISRTASVSGGSI